MTKFTDLTHEQRMLVHQATTEVYSRITSISTGAMAPLDAMADFFMTAYQMGQQAQRPGDMVVAHFQENARSVSDGAIYAATSKAFSPYDKQLQNDIAQLLESRALDTTQPLVIEEPKSDIAMMLDPNACRHLNMQHDVSGSTCLNCGAQMTTIVRVDPGQELERDDPHEDLGYKGRK